MQTATSEPPGVTPVCMCACAIADVYMHLKCTWGRKAYGDWMTARPRCMNVALLAPIPTASSQMTCKYIDKQAFSFLSIHLRSTQGHTIHEHGNGSSTCLLWLSRSTWAPSAGMPPPQRELLSFYQRVHKNVSDVFAQSCIL